MRRRLHLGDLTVALRRGEGGVEEAARFAVIDCK